MSHRRALLTIAAAAVFDTAGGLVFAAQQHLPATGGLYWAVTTATTVGYGDITPHTPLARLTAVLVMLTVIPLFSATFSLFTAGLQSARTGATEKRLRDHLNGLHDHLHERLDGIEATVNGEAGPEGRE